MISDQIYGKNPGYILGDSRISIIQILRLKLLEQTIHSEYSLRGVPVLQLLFSSFTIDGGSRHFGLAFGAIPLFGHWLFHADAGQMELLRYSNKAM